jgi:2-oxoglutarate dehydrogenase E2 component (dihydrolipoamide succinyltransferase)
VIESLASTAQLTSVVDVDVTRIDRLRCDRSDAFRARTGLGLDLFAFVAVAATRALRAFPVVNSRMEGNSVVYPDAEHVNIAVGAEAGVQSPLIRNAGDLDVEGFAGAIAAASTRAISGTLEQNEPHDGTFTLTDMGSTGVIFGTSVVMAPQVAILGAGALRREPVVVRVGDGDCLAMRSMLALSLSYDHRVVDGAEAARFLGALKGELETASFHIPR